MARTYDACDGCRYDEMEALAKIATVNGRRVLGLPPAGKHRLLYPNLGVFAMPTSFIAQDIMAEHLLSHNAIVFLKDKPMRLRSWSGHSDLR